MDLVAVDFLFLLELIRSELIMKLNEYHVAIYDLNTINHVYNYPSAPWNR